MMNTDNSDRRRIRAAISNALFGNDFAEFERLLRENPQELLWKGQDNWLQTAAQLGKIEALQILIDLGLDINQPWLPPTDPLHEPEGAIVQAATFGHLDVVRWMLDRGAQVNFQFNGLDRCLPLVGAATNGHLDVVKLLVERGADIHATGRGTNITPITQAAVYGHWNVYHYLYSLGARDLRDTTPPNYAEGHEKLVAHMAKKCGPLGDWQRTLAYDPMITIYSIPANEKTSDMHLLFTVGLSDRRLPSGRNVFFATELRWMLPPDWPISDAAFADPKHKWVFDGIDSIISQSLNGGRWPEEPRIFFNNGSSPAPLTAGTEMCAWLCLNWRGQGVILPDHRTLLIHSVFPIYDEEVAFAREQGQDALIQRFNAMDLPLSMTLQRPNAVTDWKEG